MTFNATNVIPICKFLWVLFLSFSFCFAGAHVSHLDNTPEEELNRLLRIVVDVENLFMCVHKEEDAETKQVYFFLFKVTTTYISEIISAGVWIDSLLYQISYLFLLM